MGLELLFLGTGTSAGVPMIGCRCAVCSSSDPRDHRTRPSVLVCYPPAEPGGQPRRYLIDTAPEMRMQLVRHQIERVDAVLYTHAHADHILGIDDLRRINAVTQNHLDIYGDERTLGVLSSMFRYIFESHNNVNQTFVATLNPSLLAPGRPLELTGAKWTPVRLHHGRLDVLGFRVDYPGGDGAPAGALAYCTDTSAIPEETYAQLTGLDVLVIDGLRYREHPTHMTVEQALAAIARIKPRRAYLTHIAHDISHAELEPKLPENVFLAYDGLVVRCGE